MIFVSKIVMGNSRINADLMTYANWRILARKAGKHRHVKRQYDQRKFHDANLHPTFMQQVGKNKNAFCSEFFALMLKLVLGA